MRRLLHRLTQPGRELRARVGLRLWAWSYLLEEQREAAAHQQRNLRCAGYCVLLALCGALGRIG